MKKNNPSQSTCIAPRALVTWIYLTQKLSVENGKNMKNTAKALSELRVTIRNSKTQFRKNNDTSESLFHPAGGFVYGYDIRATKDALDAFEHALPSDYMEGAHILTIVQKILMDAQQLSEDHSDTEVRDFARSVAAYMLMHAPISSRLRDNPLRQLTLVKDLSEVDSLE